MKYQAVMNPSLYHCGMRWLVVDENYIILSKHTERKYAEKEAERLNMINK